MGGGGWKGGRHEKRHAHNKDRGFRRLGEGGRDGWKRKREREREREGGEVRDEERWDGGLKARPERSKTQRDGAQASFAANASAPSAVTCSHPCIHAEIGSKE